MRTAIVLMGLMLIGSTAFAAASEGKHPAAGKIVVASVDVKQIKATRAHSTKPAVSQMKSIEAGDSRLNDYRLERDSCCGPQ